MKSSPSICWTLGPSPAPSTSRTPSKVRCRCSSALPACRDSAHLPQSPHDATVHPCERALRAMRVHGGAHARRAREAWLVSVLAHISPGAATRTATYQHCTPPHTRHKNPHDAAMPSARAITSNCWSRLSVSVSVSSRQTSSSASSSRSAQLIIALSAQQCPLPFRMPFRI